MVVWSHHLGHHALLYANKGVTIFGSTRRATVTADTFQAYLNTFNTMPGHRRVILCKVSHPKGGPKGDEQRDAEFSVMVATMFLIFDIINKAMTAQACSGKLHARGFPAVHQWHQ